MITQYLHTSVLCFVVQEQYGKYLSVGTQKVKFVEQIEKVMVTQMKHQNLPVFWLWDQLAMAAAISDTVVTCHRDVYASVEINGGLTRGQVVIDWHKREAKPPNLRLIQEVDVELYNKLVYQGVDA